MSVSSSDELFQPAHRTSEGTTTTSPKIASPKNGRMSDWNGQPRNVEKDNINHCLKSEEINDKYKDNRISQDMEDNRNLGLSSNSSGSFGSLGDNRNGHNKPVSIHDNLYLPSVEANLPLEAINPILDLDDDDDDDAFGMPLSQQDEKLLEELLR